MESNESALYEKKFGGLTKDMKRELIKDYFFSIVGDNKTPSKDAELFQDWLKSNLGGGGLNELNLPMSPGSECLIIPSELRELNISDTASGFASAQGFLPELTELPSQPVLHKIIGVTNAKIGPGLKSILLKTKIGKAGWGEDGSEAEDMVEPEFKSQHTPNYKRLEMSYDITKNAAKYSPDVIVDILFADIFNDLDVELDRGIFHGSGVSPYLTGLVAQADVQQIDGSSFNHSKAVAMFKTSRNNNGGLNSFYVMNPNDEADLRERSLISGSDRFIIENGKLNGFPVVSSTAITKGFNFFGDFSTLVITELEPGIIIIVNPFKANGTKVSIVVCKYVDLVLRNAKSIVRAINVD